METPFENRLRLLIFWYVVGLTVIAFLYVFLITFFPIPKEAQRFADTALGFILGQVLGSGTGFLLGGSAFPSSGKKIDHSSNQGKTVAEMTATITQEPSPDPTNDNDPNPGK